MKEKKIVLATSTGGVVVIEVDDVTVARFFITHKASTEIRFKQIMYVIEEEVKDALEV